MGDVGRREGIGGRTRKFSWEWGGESHLKKTTHTQHNSRVFYSNGDLEYEMGSVIYFFAALILLPEFWYLH